MPGVTRLPIAEPVMAARSRSSALVLRIGIAGVAVASAVVGWVFFADADPALWSNGYWAVRELLPAAIAFSIGGAVLLRYRKARWPAGVLLICGLLAGLALLFAGLWWKTLLKHGGFPLPLFIANGIATDLFMGLSLTVLPQLYPDGPLPGRLWKVLLGVSTGLVVVATLKNNYNFPTVLDLAEWYFWSTVVGLGWLIALASLIVRWRRGNALLRRQIIGYGIVTVIMIVVLFLSTAYGPLPHLEPAVIVALWPLAVVISIAIAVLQYHLYDVRLVIRRVVVYGGLTVALTAIFIGVYFAVLAALSGQVVATRYRWVAVVVAVGAVLAAEPCGGASRSGWNVVSSASGATRWECWRDSMLPCRTGTKTRSLYLLRSLIPWLRRSAHPRWLSLCTVDRKSRLWRPRASSKTLR
jgi:hypothetical protein